MKRIFTYKKWPGIALTLILLMQYAQAQFPKYLKQYPVVQAAGGINSIVQKNNVVYLGGDFTSIGKEPLVNGIAFDQIGASTPNTNFGSPYTAFNAVVANAIADGAGGFYVSGTFTSVGGVDRAGTARFNADGSLNPWNPNITYLNSNQLFVPIATVGNIVLAYGNFLTIGSQSYPTGMKVTALDATTGEPIPGWANLVIPGITTGQIIKCIVNDNKIYVLASGVSTGTTAGNTLLKMIDIADINNPVLSTTFALDAVKTTGAALQIIDIAASGTTVYLSGWNFTTLANHPYDAKTLAGVTFNSSLFAIDGTTGNFKQAIPTPVQPTDIAEGLAIDNNKVYLAYHVGTTGHLAAFDLTTGNDVSSSLPSLTMTNTVAPAVPVTTRRIGANYNKLVVTSDHKLIMYGGGFSTLNGVSEKTAVIDLLGNTVQDWDPAIYAAPGSTTRAVPTVIAESNGKIYFGGALSVPSSASYARNGLGAINALTGEVLPWTPADFSGAIKTMSIYNNTLYIGGNFSGTKTNLAAYDISDPINPVLITGFTPNPDAVVSALTFNGSKLYVGGDFQNISGQPQKRLAEFDISSSAGILNTTWNPGPDNAVNALTVLNNILYTGGDFLNIGATPRSLAAAFDIGTSGNGSITSWNPMIALNNPGFHVYTLAAQAADGTNHDGRIFIGGNFFQIGAGSTAVQSLAVTNITDGALDAWQLPAGVNTNNVNTLFIDNNKLYFAGDFGLNSADISNNFAQIDPATYITNANVNSILARNSLLFAGGSGNNSFSSIDPNLKGLMVFQIGQLQGQLTFADFAKNYGDTDAAPAATSNNTGLPITYVLSEQKDINGNAATVAEITTDNKLHILMPGTAKITASQAGNADFIVPADVAAILTINKAVLTIHPQDEGSVVNQPLPDFPFTLTGWVPGDETKSGIYTGKPEFTTTATETSPVGPYPITVSGVGTLVSDFYTFTPSADQATLTITLQGATPQTITFAALANKMYGDADITLSGTTDATGLSVRYTSSDQNVATVTGNKLHIAGAGPVTITASQPGNATYAIAPPIDQSFTVSPALLTVTANNFTRDRGFPNPAFTVTYSGFVNGDNVNKLSSPATAVANPNPTPTSPGGSYPIIPSGASSNNYTFNYVNGTLTVNNNQLLTFNTFSTVTYGDADFDLISSSDQGGTPTYTTNNPGVAQIVGGKVHITGAGTADITATFPAAGGYDISTIKQTLTVQKKNLTIQADDKSRNFGAGDPIFTFTYAGFVNNDTYSTPGALITEAIATTNAKATSPKGNYPITVSGATSNNYAISFRSGTLTISNLTRALTFNPIAAKTYGNADFDAASLNSGEQVVYTFSNPSVATAVNGKIHITGAGTTDITASAPVNGNYNTVNSVTQTLTVGKAPLTITANNLSKTQGPPDITLTASYNGFVNNDNQLNLATRPILTSTATTNSAIGKYPISVSGASSPNYDITYQNGTLEIILAVSQDEVIIASQALSPDGDGVNDYFQIGGISNFPTNHVTIINRNGVQVWEASGYDNSSKKFDGHTSNGNQLQQGTYYFLVNYTVNGQKKKKSGYLIIKY